MPTADSSTKTAHNKNMRAWPWLVLIAASFLVGLFCSIPGNMAGPLPLLVALVLVGIAGVGTLSSRRYAPKVNPRRLGISAFVIATIASVLVLIPALILALTSLPVFLLTHSWTWPWDAKPIEIAGANWATAENNARQGVLLALGGVLAVVGLIFTWLRHRRDELLSKIESDRHWTHRYTEAVTQLGSESLAVQLGGVYALERLAQDAPSTTDRQTIAEVFAAYLREYSAVPDDVDYESDGFPPMSTLCRSIAEALARVVHRRLDRPLNLSYVNLSGASLDDADMSDWDLSMAWMWRTSLDSSVLSGAVLPGVKLIEAGLANSVLDRTRMHDAKLDGCDMTNVDFTESELSRSDFGHAFVKGATFRGSNLLWSDLTHIQEFTSDQLDQAGGWDEETKWPDGYQPTQPEKNPGNQPPIHS
jgi:hypothetical protein